jgi:hypothetical protein
MQALRILVRLYIDNASGIAVARVVNFLYVPLVQVDHTPTTSPFRMPCMRADTCSTTHRRRQTGAGDTVEHADYAHLMGEKRTQTLPRKYWLTYSNDFRLNRMS